MAFCASLSDDLLLHVLSFVRSRDLCACSGVTARWRRLAQTDSLWQGVAPALYDTLCETIEPAQLAGLWREAVVLSMCSGNVVGARAVVEELRLLEQKRFNSLRFHNAQLRRQLQALEPARSERASQQRTLQGARAAAAWTSDDSSRWELRGARASGGGSGGGSSEEPAGREGRRRGVAAAMEAVNCLKSSLRSVEETIRALEADVTNSKVACRSLQAERAELEGRRERAAAALHDAVGQLRATTRLLLHEGRHATYAALPAAARRAFFAAVYPGGVEVPV